MKIPAFTEVRAAKFTSEPKLIIVPHDMPPEDILVPGNWAHISAKINTYDEVLIFPEDRAWRLHVFVEEAAPGYVRIALLHRWDRASKAKAGKVDTELLEAPEGYKIDHTPKTGWRAFLKDPLIEISRNNKSRNEATQAAIEHSRNAQGVAA